MPIHDAEHGEAKRPRLDFMADIHNPLSPSPYQSITTDTAMIDRPFSAILSKLGQQTKNQLSDKKLIVYDLKVNSSYLTEEYKLNGWHRLENAIHSIQNNERPSESLEVLYQLSENLCQNDQAAHLYDKLRSTCRNYIENKFKVLESDPAHSTGYLEIVNQLWMSYCDQMKQIQCIVLYLDRSYRSILEMGNELFSMCFQQSKPVHEKVVNSILNLIMAERNGESINSLLLKSNLRMLMDLNLYHSGFEGQFLERTRQYYQAEGDKLVNEMQMSKYLKHVSDRIHQESVVRLKQYFDKSTKAALTAIVDETLLSIRVDTILDKCFDYFMDNKRIDDISLLYRLLTRVGQLDTCVKYFTNYVKTKGTSIIRDHTKVEELFAFLSSFVRRVDNLVQHSFEEDELFVSSYKECLDHFLNIRQNNVTVLLSNYIDYLLKHEKTDDKSLDAYIMFFRLLQSKDSFEILYRQDLAKRLLLDVGSAKSEKMILNKMKKESGAAYTSKLEKMLRDIKHSRELMVEYKEHLNPAYYHNINFNVNVLTYGFWPSYTPIDIILPSTFQKLQSDFNSFYTNKYQKRRLTWQNGLSICEVHANFPKKTQSITLTLIQTVILLIFNDTSKTIFSFGDILSATNLDELELRRTLKSLACGQHQFIIKYPAGQDVEQTDQFVYNNDFISTEEHISMNTEKLKEAIENNASIIKTVLISRDQQVDAAVVRILKSKQTLSHGALLGEVTKQIRFPVTAQEVKKRIELLIEKEYIERTDDNGYRYT